MSGQVWTPAKLLAELHNRHGNDSSGYPGFGNDAARSINGKNFGTSISLRIVALDALKRFRVEGLEHEQTVASYLSSPEPGSHSVDLVVEIISHNTRTITCCSNPDKSLH